MVWYCQLLACIGESNLYLSEVLFWSRSTFVAECHKPLAVSTQQLLQVSPMCEDWLDVPGGGAVWRGVGKGGRREGVGEVGEEGGRVQHRGKA